jgi:formate-dependent nitrite reductase membrane component NrfD
MYKVITTGTLGFWFLGVELFLGEVVPLAMLSFPHIRKSMVGQNIACLLVLMGIFVMRMVIVIGGQSIPLH